MLAERGTTKRHTYFLRKLIFTTRKRKYLIRKMQIKQQNCWNFLKTNLSSTSHKLFSRISIYSYTRWAEMSREMFVKSLMSMKQLLPNSYRIRLILWKGEVQLGHRLPRGMVDYLTSASLIGQFFLLALHHNTPSRLQLLAAVGQWRCGRFCLIFGTNPSASSTNIRSLPAITASHRFSSGSLTR